MSTATIVMEGEGRRLPRPLTGADSATRRLAECARTLRQRVRKLHPEGETKAPAAVWLVDNHSYLQAQIRETQRSLPGALCAAAAEDRRRRQGGTPCFQTCRGFVGAGG